MNSIHSNATPTQKTSASAITLALLLGVISHAQAQARDSDQIRPTLRERSQLNRLIRCVQDVTLEQTRATLPPTSPAPTGVETIPALIAGNLLEKARQGVMSPNTASLMESLEACRRIQRTGRLPEKEVAVWKQHLEQSNQMRDGYGAILSRNLPEPAGLIMRDLLQGAYSQVFALCWRVGAQFVAGLGVGGGAALEGAYCRARDGKQWLELVPTVYLARGVGGTLTASLGGSRGMLINTGTIPFHRADTQDILAYGVGAAILFDFDSVEVLGIGVGLGNLYGQGYEHHLRLLPLPLHVHSLSRRLLAPETLPFSPSQQEDPFSLP